ncbi:MAG TPA: glycine cleavage system aminomethyltransferase GcvT [Chitinophagales bacterium]|nr:glycine cleavage system aminomethyltransferase GcvT [Chitinophagales bacterium]
MKTTALTPVHISLGAKMSEFAGYNMPIVYTSINEEHLAVRSSVGVFDVSHMGEFLVKGKKALDLVQKVTTNDAAKLVPGKAQYSCLTNQAGGIVDDLLVYMLDENEYLLVVNASNIEKDWNWITQFKGSGVKMNNISDDITLLAVQGPRAADALQPLTKVDLKAIPYYSFVRDRFAGISNVIISTTGYTGAGGFELYFDRKYSEKVWNAVFAAGKDYGIKPVGLAARDTLRLEMGYCLYGNDIDETTTPLEAGLGWITKFNKEFIGWDALLKQKQEGVKRRLIGFVLTDRGIARHGYPLRDAEGNIIGSVTSGTMSPSLKKPIGMGYVTISFAHPGSEIFVQIRDNTVRASVVKFPFLTVEKEVAKV